MEKWITFAWHLVRIEDINIVEKSNTNKDPSNITIDCNFKYGGCLIEQFATIEARDDRFKNILKLLNGENK